MGILKKWCCSLTALWRFLLVYVLTNGLYHHYSFTKRLFFLINNHLFWQAILVVLLGSTDLWTKFCKWILGWLNLLDLTIPLLIQITVNAHCNNFFRRVWFRLCPHKDLHMQVKKERKIYFWPKFSDLLYCVVQTQPLSGLHIFTQCPHANIFKCMQDACLQCGTVHEHAHGRLPGALGCKGEWHGSICRLPSGCQSLVTPVGSDKLRHKRRSH